MSNEIPRHQDPQNDWAANVPLAEGKTKVIWETDDPSVVRVESKSDITAGDGLKRNVIDGKDVLSTDTTSNVFTLLNEAGIYTHFLQRDTPTSFLARRADMIPLECVIRRIATGSYIKRNPEVPEGEVLSDFPVEFYFKDDAHHDPLVEVVGDEIVLFDAKDPKNSRQPIQLVSPDQVSVTPEELTQMRRESQRVFEVIESAWSQQDVALVDLKIEFGKDGDGTLMVADVIDNDSWRIWPAGDKSQMLDKQVYRNTQDPTEEDLERVRSNYQKVAEMTEEFTVK